MSAVRVLLADDHRLVRAGFRLILENDPEIEIVAEAATGEEAVALSLRHRPDVVLMDIQMPGGDGVDATRRIMAEPALAGTSVVMLTTFEVDEHIADAIDAGASGFLLKDIEPAEPRARSTPPPAGRGRSRRASPRPCCDSCVGPGTAPEVQSG